MATQGAGKPLPAAGEARQKFRANFIFLPRQFEIISILFFIVRAFPADEKASRRFACR
jgi:hypothetical protein